MELMHVWACLISTWCCGCVDSQGGHRSACVDASAAGRALPCTPCGASARTIAIQAPVPGRTTMAAQQPCTSVFVLTGQMQEFGTGCKLLVLQFREQAPRIPPHPGKRSSPSCGPFPHAWVAHGLTPSDPLACLHACYRLLPQAPFPGLARRPTVRPRPRGLM